MSFRLIQTMMAPDPPQNGFSAPITHNFSKATDLQIVHLYKLKQQFRFSASPSKPACLIQGPKTFSLRRPVRMSCISCTSSSRHIAQNHLLSGLFHISQCITRQGKWQVGQLCGSLILLTTPPDTLSFSPIPNPVTKRENRRKRRWRQHNIE